MKILTIKPGTKIRTKKYERIWVDKFLNQEGIVIGAGHESGWIRIQVLGTKFDVVPQEIELVKPLKLKRFSAWK